MRPPQYGHLVAMPPEKFLKFYMQICTFWCFLASLI